MDGPMTRRTGRRRGGTAAEGEAKAGFVWRQPSAAFCPHARMRTLLEDSASTLIRGKMADRSDAKASPRNRLGEGERGGQRKRRGRRRIRRE